MEYDPIIYQVLSISGHINRLVFPYFPTPPVSRGRSPLPSHRLGETRAVGRLDVDVMSRGSPIVLVMATEERGTCYQEN